MKGSDQTGRSGFGKMDVGGGRRVRGWLVILVVILGLTTSRTWAVTVDWANAVGPGCPEGQLAFDGGGNNNDLVVHVIGLGMAEDLTNVNYIVTTSQGVSQIGTPTCTCGGTTVTFVNNGGGLSLSCGTTVICSYQFEVIPSAAAFTAVDVQVCIDTTTTSGVCTPANGCPTHKILQLENAGIDSFFQGDFSCEVGGAVQRLGLGFIGLRLSADSNYAEIVDHPIVGIATNSFSPPQLFPVGSLGGWLASSPMSCFWVTDNSPSIGSATAIPPNYECSFQFDLAINTTEACPPSWTTCNELYYYNFQAQWTPSSSGKVIQLASGVTWSGGKLARLTSEVFPDSGTCDVIPPVATVGIPYTLPFNILVGRICQIRATSSLILPPGVVLSGVPSYSGNCIPVAVSALGTTAWELSSVPASVVTPNWCNVTFTIQSVAAPGTYTFALKTVKDTQQEYSESCDVIIEPPSISPSGSVSTSNTPSNSRTPSITSSPSVTGSISETPSVTGSNTPSNTPSTTSSPTITSSPSITASPSASISVTSSRTPSITSSVSITPSFSSSASVTASNTMSPSITASRTTSRSSSASVSVTPTHSVSLSMTISTSGNPTSSRFPTASRTTARSNRPEKSNDAVCSPSNCDDSNPCTVDFCTGNGCVHQETFCDDGDPCTRDFCSSSGCHHVRDSQCEERLEKCSSFQTCGECEVAKDCGWMFCGLSSVLHQDMTFLVLNNSTTNGTSLSVLYTTNGTQQFSFTDARSVHVSFGSMGIHLTNDLSPTFWSSSAWSQGCVPIDFASDDGETGSECIRTEDCEVPDFNFLQTQSTEIGVSVAVSAASSAFFCGACVFGLLFYRRKKIPLPLVLSSQQQEVNWTSKENTSHVEKGGLNPLFNA